MRHTVHRDRDFSCQRVHHVQRRREHKLARRGQRQLIGRLTIMRTRIFDRRDLERTFHRAKIGHDDLKIRGQTVKEQLGARARPWSRP